MVSTQSYLALCMHVYDSHVFDSHVYDSHVYDSNVYDSHVYDSHVFDLHVYDSHVYDSHVYDSHVYDSHMYDSHVFDSHVYDSHVYDSHMFDSHVYDSHVYDSHVYDSHVYDSHVFARVAALIHQQECSTMRSSLYNHILALLFLVGNLFKFLKPWHIGIHQTVLWKSFQTNSIFKGLTCPTLTVVVLNFSKKFPLVHYRGQHLWVIYWELFI